MWRVRRTPPDPMNADRNCRASLPSACFVSHRSVPPHSLDSPERSESPRKIAQEQLGHASIQTTLNIYPHVVDASHRRAIEAVERELFPSVPKSADQLANAVPVSDTVN